MREGHEAEKYHAGINGQWKHWNKCRTVLFCNKMSTEWQKAGVKQKLNVLHGDPLCVSR